MNCHVTKIPCKLIFKSEAFPKILMKIRLKFYLVKATKVVKKYFLVYSSIVAVRRLGFIL